VVASKKPPPVARPPDKGFRSVTDQLGPRLRAEFEQLQKSERKILAALAKPETAARFATDPLTVLKELKIEVPPLIGQRLKSAASNSDFSDLAQPHSFRLPDGQVVTAIVNVRISGAKDSKAKDSKAKD
jgi:hypothetical protein